jgi:hypothetical protein
VIAALDGETSPEPALRLAFEEATLRDARLVVLHAEPMNASPDDVSAAGSDLGKVLERWKLDHADVAVSTVIVSGDPDAQLTVVAVGGRFGGRPPASASLGTLDPVGGPQCDETNALPAHRGAASHGGRRRTSPAGRAGPDLIRPAGKPSPLSEATQPAVRYSVRKNERTDDEHVPNRTRPSRAQQAPVWLDR